jgi:hypothetical protein
VTLRDLFSPGSTLADVPDTFRGATLEQWRCAQVAEQSSQLLENVTPEERENAPIIRQAIATPRDNYGIKGAHALPARYR